MAVILRFYGDFDKHSKETIDQIILETPFTSDQMRRPCLQAAYLRGLRTWKEHSGAIQVEMMVPSGWPRYTVSPNFSEWKKGDIVLIKSSGSPKDIGIVTRQALSLNRATRDGRMWVHAALYVGDGEIIDITPAHGAVQRSLWVYCKDHDITVRRVPNLTDAQRDKAVNVASDLVMRCVSYSRWQVIVSTLVPNTVPNPNELYCSTLVGHAFNAGCNKQLYFQPMYRPLYPGTLAENQALDAVDLEWRPI